MRKFSVAVTTALLAGSLLVATEPATATVVPENSACVTKAEFQRVTEGMTRAHVADIFGTDGTLALRQPSSGHVYMLRDYPACQAHSRVSVTYRDGLETKKSAHWGTL